VKTKLRHRIAADLPRRPNRARRLVTFTISDEAREAIDVLRRKKGETKSRFIERLVLDEKTRTERK
jgi:Ribbon-helix-helix protein, copG family